MRVQDLIEILEPMADLELVLVAPAQPGQPSRTYRTCKEHPCVGKANIHHDDGRVEEMTMIFLPGRTTDLD